jgi:hypothetical protein
MSGVPPVSDKSFRIEFELDGAERERMVVVGSDLEFLRDLPEDRLPTHTEVRLAAGVLRRLLVDGLLDAAWRPIGKKSGAHLIVEATEIDSALAKWPAAWLRYAWAGGARSKVAHHTGFILAAVPRQEHEKYESPEAMLAENPLPLTGERRRMTVKSWLDSTSVAIRTNELGVVAVSRRSVLKYIANRKGGVHFSQKRDLVLQNAKKRRAEVEHHLLDHGLLRVGHLSGPEYEVASMAQAVASSDWAEQFVTIARDVAPEEFDGDPRELKFWTGVQEEDGTGWATSRFGPTRTEGGE